MLGASGYLLSPEAPDSCYEARQDMVIKSNMGFYGESASVREGPGRGGGSWKSLSRRGKARTCGHQSMPGGGAAG